MAEQDLKDLEVLSGEPVVIMVGGKPYKAGMLTAADFAACSSWRASQQASEILNLRGKNPLVDDTALKAEAIAKIMTKEFSPTQLLNDSNCILRLAEIMLQRGGEWVSTPANPNTSFESFKKKIDPIAYRDLEIAVFKMSGYWNPKMEESLKEGTTTEGNPTSLPTPS